MEYKGRLYGKVGGSYFPTGKTADDWDELEASQPKWISVEDRLPTKEDADENGKVLLYREATASQKPLSKSINDWALVKYLDKGYWQSLPKPPTT